MHAVFHVRLLKQFKSDGTLIPPPVPELISIDLQYEAEDVIDDDSRKKRYLVEWKGH